MMPKQIPDMSQDIETKKDAELYAKSVMERLNIANNIINDLIS